MRNNYNNKLYDNNNKFNKNIYLIIKIINYRK